MENDPLGEIVYYSRDRRAIIQNFLEAVIPNALHHQRQMSIMGEIGKVELDFSGLFVNVPESAIIMSLACTSPIYPLLGNLQLIKPDKVSVSGKPKLREHVRHKYCNKYGIFHISRPPSLIAK